jgi:putative flippase GtrA
VEIAIVHNFFWHEQWTWSDRAPDAAVWPRVSRFHAANGLTSLAGNAGLMALLVGVLGLARCRRTLQPSPSSAP